MLSLTSQLTQSKMRQVAPGAARSLQTPGSGGTDISSNTNNKNNGNDDNNASSANSNNDNNESSNNNIYSQTTPYPTFASDASPTPSLEDKQLQFRRLQQYWDEYYKRYYASIGKGKACLFCVKDQCYAQVHRYIYKSICCLKIALSVKL